MPSPSKWQRARGVSFDYSPFGDPNTKELGIDPAHHQTAWCAEKAITFIEANAPFDDPWLLSVNPFDPHHPFDPPREYLEPYLDRLGDIPLPNYRPGGLRDKPLFRDSATRAPTTSPAPSASTTWTTPTTA